MGSGLTGTGWSEQIQAHASEKWRATACRQASGRQLGGRAGVVGWPTAGRCKQKSFVIGIQPTIMSAHVRAVSIKHMCRNTCTVAGMHVGGGSWLPSGWEKVEAGSAQAGTHTAAAGGELREVGIKNGSSNVLLYVGCMIRPLCSPQPCRIEGHDRAGSDAGVQGRGPARQAFDTGPSLVAHAPHPCRLTRSLARHRL